MCENRFDSSESSAIGQKQRPSNHCKIILETKNSGLSIHFLEVTTYLVVGRGEASAPRCFRSLMSKRNWSFTKHDSCVESCVSGCSCVCPHMCVYVYTCTHTCIHVEVLPWVLSILCFEAEALVLEPAMQARLCGQQAPGIHLSKLPQCWD